MKLLRITSDYTKRDDFRTLVREGLLSRDLGVPISEIKLTTFCDACANGHYGAVAEHDGRCVAYLGAVLADHYWYDRMQLNVVGWYSKHPFAGIRLLEMALQWAQSQPHIRTVLLNVNPEFEEQVRRILKKRKNTAHVVSSILIEV